MQPPIMEAEKNKIIDYYMQGVRPQSSIALLVGRSEGTVSNVIRQFLNQAGEQNIDAMRELIAAMSKAGIHTDDCVRAYRMIQILSKMGIALDDEKDTNWIIKLESFIENVYKEARSIGLPEGQIVEYSKQLLEVSKNESIDPAHVADFCEIKQKQLGETSKELEELEHRKKKALEDCQVTEADLHQFKYVRDELRKHNLAIDSVPKLVNLLNNAEKLGYNPSNLAAKVSTLESIEQEIGLRASVCNKLGEELVKSSKTCESLEKEIEANSELRSELKQLKDMGVGVEQLRVLKETISGIIAASELVVDMAGVDNTSSYSTKKKLTPRQAFRKFFVDVEKHYDKLLGFEYYVDQKSRLQAEIQELDSRIAIIDQIRDFFSEKVEKLESATKSLHQDSKIIESFKPEVTETKQAFKDLRQMVQPIYQETNDLIRQCKSIVSNNTQNYEYSLALLVVKGRNLQKIIRALAGERIPVVELAWPVILSLDAIIPALALRNNMDAKTKCEQARFALERIIGRDVSIS